jgi:ferredoxin
MTEIKYLASSQVDKALKSLASKLELYVPLAVSEREVPRLTRLPAIGHIILEPRKPLLPLKSLFQPDSEDLFRFERVKDGLTIESSHAPIKDRLVLGTLACDVASLDLLDRVMLEKPADVVYRDLRRRTTIVALACPGEGEECFCASAGIDPLRPSGADALLVPVEGGFLVEALNTRGKKFFKLISGLTRNPTNKELKAAIDSGSASCKDVPLAAPSEGWSAVWDDNLWEELASRCLNCGLCTVVCPTCHCFDLQDEHRGSAGTRLRVWDSCMYSDFTQMASGENPREKRHTRVRQRFLHKLCYFQENYGVAACVGCGRCTRNCPVGIGIVEVARSICPVESVGGGDE